MYMEKGSKEFGYLEHLIIIDPYDMKREDYNVYLSGRGKGQDKEEWLFDSFLLFNTLSSGNDSIADINVGNTMCGEGNFYAVPSPNPANRKDFLETIDSFIKGCKVMSEEVEKTSLKIGEPEFKRNVVVTIPYPGINQCNFGKVNGKELNFSVLGQNLTEATEDRLTACKWFVDEFLDRWEKENIKNINLLGFYWIFESVYRGWDVDDHWLLKELHSYVNQKNKKMFWIPFWSSYNVHLLDNYKDYYFDAAFVQPNYMFYENIEDVKEGAEAAEKRNAGFEMEYFLPSEEPTQIKTNRRERFRGYLNGGVKYGYMNAACAWFIGGGFHTMPNYPEEMEYYYDIIDFVKGRYKIK